MEPTTAAAVSPAQRPPWRGRGPPTEVRAWVQRAQCISVRLADESLTHVDLRAAAEPHKAQHVDALLLHTRRPALSALPPPAQPRLAATDRAGGRAWWVVDEAGRTDCFELGVASVGAFALEALAVHQAADLTRSNIPTVSGPRPPPDGPSARTPLGGGAVAAARPHPTVEGVLASLL
eukprot:SAG11_NODE_3111_length_2679_cov_3.682558_2_plen_178_part_00